MHAHARICLDMHAHACKMLGYAHPCMHMHGYARFRMDMHAHARICSDMHAHAWICTPMHAYARIGTPIHAYARPCIFKHTLLSVISYRSVTQHRPRDAATPFSDACVMFASYVVPCEWRTILRAQLRAVCCSLRWAPCCAHGWGALLRARSLLATLRALCC